MQIPGKGPMIYLLAALAAVPRAGAVDSEPVTFSTSDGVAIAADYYAPTTDVPPAPIVILLHMYRSDRTAWKPLIGPLHDVGFAILAIDLRGHGASATPETRKAVDQRRTAVFEAMQSDVRAAYDWLAARDEVDRTRFALVGASVGCSVALEYAADDRSVDAIVCLSPGEAYLGLDSKADIQRITGRRIWLVASDDASERRGVDALAPLASGSEKTLFPGRLHGTRMLGNVPALEQRIAEFLKNAVGGPAERPVYADIEADVYHPAGSAAITSIAPKRLRCYSSPNEATERGLRQADSEALERGASRKRGD